MLNYFAFVIENRRFLAFGLSLAFFASFGQTYFVALFGAEIRATFSLSHGEFGGVYSAATLASAASLVWLGRLIDVVDLRLYSALACAGLALACLLMAGMTSTVVLFVAIYGLRLTGQGIMSHASVTSMARYFDSGRGKALSIASLGHSLGNAVFPLATVSLIALVGWRGAWAVIGIGLGVLVVPLVLWTLKGHGERHRRFQQRAAADTPRGTAEHHEWTRREVLRDGRFYRLLPAVMAQPFIMTAFFFHQVHLAQSKGWSLTLVATGFVAFAAAMVATLLAAGPLVDRFGALRVLPYFLIPMALGMVLIATLSHPATVLLYLILFGIGGGLSVTVLGAVWAEIYGVVHLGAIRSMAWALTVFASALSPGAIGWLIDLDVSMATIAAASAGYIVFASALIAAPMTRAVDPIRGA